MSSQTESRVTPLQLAPGLLSAVCFAISPVFLRKGLALVPDAPLAVVIGMTSALVPLAVVLALTGFRRPAGPRVNRSAFLRLELVAGIALAIATLLRYAAVARVPIGVVATAIRLHVPLVLLFAPRFIPGARERTNLQTWIGVILIVAGAIVVGL